MDRVWRPVVGWEKYYEVASDGSVRRIAAARGARPGRELAAAIHRQTGYLRVALTRNGEMRKVKVHLLVAEAFLPPRPSLAHEVNHRDSDRANPRLENLEWVTRRENLDHARKLGRMSPPPRHEGARHPMSKLTSEEVASIRNACTTPLRRGVMAKLALEYGVTRQAIRRIVKGEVWK